ncbi:TetR family transcriptional regulator [Christiangramia gaetbulicola]|uniref:TetR family transcriptional regulator n=1 Tax=Christiangramia gaetbulicola TaxID=703340 RepID=A0A2T6AGP9_9FLAO|nr:TetR/AcrR family transcriptional regulator [Christiangramia gaetbulicola]PTX43003.1 TetR family transcriptional regulator [Christiangramia gaetbulicola]
MKHLLQDIKISVSDRIYLKDPESTALGKRIVEHGILLIDDIGFENFTFRKLGKEIKSNESSIYRYFENKHKFLVYITSWFWGWKEYQLVFATHSISDDLEKLNRAIEVITKPVEEDSQFGHINEVALSNIIVNESSKSYLTKEVDEENMDGYFSIYKRLVKRLSEMLSAVNDSYPYPASLASTIIEGTLHQHFLREHFTSITDCNDKITPTEYFKDMVNSIIKS